LRSFLEGPSHSETCVSGGNPAQLNLMGSTFSGLMTVGESTLGEWSFTLDEVELKSLLILALFSGWPFGFYYDFCCH